MRLCQGVEALLRHVKVVDSEVVNTKDHREQHANWGDDSDQPLRRIVVAISLQKKCQDLGCGRDCMADLEEANGQLDFLVVRGKSSSGEQVFLMQIDEKCDRNEESDVRDDVHLGHLNALQGF